ncbi:MAG: serine hydrolase [Deltaproteobacteria bacterium]|nr:serine hydrolase [Deltaproteobacteria bacterium]
MKRPWKISHPLLVLLLTFTVTACSDDVQPGPDAGVDTLQTDTLGEGILVDAAPPKYRGQVDELVRPMMEGKWTAGLVVGLVSADGKEVYTYGEVAAGGAKPDEHTLFEVGSITKTFTSLVLAELAADGEVMLTDPVKALLPSSEVTMPSHKGEEITLLHLSTHTSGLPRMPDNFTSPTNPEDPYGDYTVDQLYTFLNGYTLPRAPGATWEYSNLAGALLGHTLALKAGETYPALVAERITSPLNLQDTVFTLSSEQSERFAQGHNGDLKARSSWELEVFAPAGGLRSSAQDMLSYLAAQAGITTSSLSTSMAETHTSRFKSSNVEMGLGWVIGDTGYHWHNGTTGGFETFVAFDTQAKVGVVVLANTLTAYYAQTSLGKALIKLMTKQSYEPVALPPSVSVSAETLDLYVGTYSADFTVTITREGDALVLAQAGHPDQPLYAKTEKIFYRRTKVVEITFVKDSTGAYPSLSYSSSDGTTTLFRAP